jgi:hypothetical protein
MDVAASAPAKHGSSIWARLGVMLGAVVIGLVLNVLMQRHLATLQTLAATDPIAARARLAHEVRVGGLLLFTLTGALGVSLMHASRVALRVLQFPPPGLWGFGAGRTIHGPAARPFAFGGIVLGSLLLLCSLAGGALSWEMATRLLTCRAGVTSTDSRAGGELPHGNR